MFKPHVSASCFSLMFQPHVLMNMFLIKTKLLLLHDVMTSIASYIMTSAKRMEEGSLNLKFFDAVEGGGNI